MDDRVKKEFDKLYENFKLSENDAAWHIFKSGWDARARFEYELDLRIAELEAEARTAKPEKE